MERFKSTYREKVLNLYLCGGYAILRTISRPSMRNASHSVAHVEVFPQSASGQARRVEAHHYPGP
jgi:hypothetical protein